MKTFSKLWRRPRASSPRVEDVEAGNENKDSVDNSEDEIKTDDDQMFAFVPVLADRAYDLMAANLFQQAITRGHVKINDADAIFIRRAKKEYVSFPPEVIEGGLWHDILRALNIDAGLHMSNDLIQAVVDSSDGQTPWISIDAEMRIQVVDSIGELQSARKSQNAAFVRRSRSLFIWSDNAHKVLEDADGLLVRMMATVWERRNDKRPRRALKFVSASRAEPEAVDPLESSSKETIQKDQAEILHTVQNSTATFENAHHCEDQVTNRPIMLFAPITTGLAIILAMAIAGDGIGVLIKEYMLDGDATRFALLVTLPFRLCVSTFFLLFLVGQLWHIVGPVSHLKANSRFYSGERPKWRSGLALPEFTVIVPVYKEGLETVIVPTVESLNKAITTYERQGGCARILVCEDGMQCISPELQAARREFYDRQGMAWIARPPHGDDFIRKGRFKKASNMNFGFELSLRVEELMTGHSEDDQEPIEMAYEQALDMAIAESQGKAWAAGNIRIGELLLIVDCDTRVPSDCFLDAANEFNDSPELAILQHESGVLLVIEHYFERGIAFFTERINKAITYCTANGETAPFVGHNAFLRWSALQDVAMKDEDGNTKIWSESHVSEDFDVSLRLLISGYITRWATYSNGEFKEGVSLTINDEIGRWQKYAYGCSELLFRPLFRWYRGPVSPLVRKFVWSNVPLHSKISGLSYIFSYYAIACGFPFTVMNWMLQGVMKGNLDGYYLGSWEIWISLVVVFVIAGNISGAILSHRRMEYGLGHALLEYLKWVPFFFVFFGGISYHVSTALLAHMVGYNMLWAGTVKEVEVSNFFKEIPHILKKFWPLYLICLSLIAAIIVMTMDFIPKGYRILGFVDIAPFGIVVGSHILLPLVLNPWLMKFHF